jgi:hypothetical protein
VSVPAPDLEKAPSPEITEVIEEALPLFSVAVTPELIAIFRSKPTIPELKTRADEPVNVIAPEPIPLAAPIEIEPAPICVPPE